MVVSKESFVNKISSSNGLAGKCKDDEVGEESTDELDGECAGSGGLAVVVVVVVMGSVAAAAAAATFWIDLGDMAVVE